MTKVSKGPLITVIVPVYNVEKYLDKCVESIVNQTYENLEIILVDDGSPDKSPKMCDDWAKKDKRIKAIHKENKGVSSARNTGIDKSKGEWITFVDADDYVEENYVEDMLAVSEDFNTNYICCGYNKIYNNKTEKINSNGEIIELNKKDFLVSLLNVQKSYGFVHMKLIHRDIISNIRFDEELPVGEDALFNVQLCKNLDKAVIYNKSLYNYRINLNSVVRKYDEHYVDKYTKSMSKMKAYIDEKYKSDEIVELNIYNYIVYHLMLICVNYCYHPKNEKKFKSLRQVCKMNIYKQAIKNSNYDNLSLSRKVTLFTMKTKLLFLTALICKIRQSQIRK